MPYSDKEKARRLDYRLAHKEQIRAHNRRYYCANRDKILAQVKLTGPHHNRTLEGRYTQLKSSAKTRNLPIDIDFKTFCDLVRLNQCLYCGSKLSETGPGLDRQDHTKGYLVGNVVPCCKECNSRKGLLEAAGFCHLRAIELLHELNGKRKDNA